MAKTNGIQVNLHDVMEAMYLTHCTKAQMIEVALYIYHTHLDDDLEPYFDLEAETVDRVEQATKYVNDFLDGFI